MNVTVECSRCATAPGVVSQPCVTVVYAMAVGGFAGGCAGGGGGCSGGGDVGEPGGTEGPGGAAGSTTGAPGGGTLGGGGGGVAGEGTEGGGGGGVEGTGGSECGAAAAPPGQKQPPSWPSSCTKDLHAVLTYQYSVSGFARAVK